MSVIKRLISGSAAAWLTVGIVMISQIVLVPIFLTYWNVEVYGIWLAIQSILGIIIIVEKSYHVYLANEFLRISAHNRSDMGVYVLSGTVFSLGISICLFVLIFILVISGHFNFFFKYLNPSANTILDQAGIALIIQMAGLIFTSALGSVATHALYALGYYPRLTWWGLLPALSNALSPALAVSFGAGIVTTSVVLAISSVLFTFPLYYDIWHILKKEKVHLQNFSKKIGIQSFTRSLLVAVNGLSDNFKQQGIRIVLAPLSGISALVTFTTIRTGSYAALMGLNTITNPLMPDLIRFIHLKEQQKIEAGFGIIWIILILLMVPSVVILQAVVEPLFVVWTRGKVVFDPELFAILSFDVLIFAITQPAMAVISRNNLLKNQLIISLSTSIIVILGMIITIPYLGLNGAGISLLIAEIVACYAYRYAAIVWLHKIGVKWPDKSFKIALTSIVIAIVSVEILIYLPSFKIFIVTCSVILLIINAWRFWLVLPVLAHKQVYNIMSKTPILRIFFAL